MCLDDQTFILAIIFFNQIPLVQFTQSIIGMPKYLKGTELNMKPMTLTQLDYN